MEKKFPFIIFSVFALICLLFTACPTDSDLLIGGGQGDAWGIPPFDGTVDARGDGWAGAGSVGVYITLRNGIIVEVEFDLARETDHIVRPHPGRIRPIVLQTNSFDAIPELIIAGASDTTRGIIQAGNAALATIPGVGENGEGGMVNCEC